MTELGIKQEDLKKPLGVDSRGAVGHYLTGRRDPTPAQIVALATELRWSLDELLIGRRWMEAAEESGLSPEAIKIARTWQNLPKETREAVRLLLSKASNHK